MTRAASKPERANRGFTLVEILVVLAIIAAVTALIPRMLAGAPTVQLRAAAEDMVAKLRELHDQAIRRGMPTEITLDPASSTYMLSTAATRYRLPDVIERIDFQTPRALRAGPQIRVRFFPDGSATGGTLSLKHGDRAVGVTIEWQTGRVARNG